MSDGQTRNLELLTYVSYGMIELFYKLLLPTWLLVQAQVESDELSPMNWQVLARRNA
jgi:hypothetical protein